jgi:hypothetical protein
MRTKRALDSIGYLNANTEQWIRVPDSPIGGIRRDLFGFCDRVAIGEGTLLFIQCTVQDRASDHVLAVLKNDAARKICEIATLFHGTYGDRIPYRVQVWAWAKRGARGEKKTWTVKIIDLTLKLAGQGGVLEFTKETMPS